MVSIRFDITADEFIKGLYEGEFEELLTAMLAEATDEQLKANAAITDLIAEAVEEAEGE